ncbi:MAG: chorismate-binding protein, partial [Spongiibacter sp.]
IAELEPARRSLYCGSVFYISAGGTVDSSITIRSFVCQDGTIRGWAGGGIVADSNVDEELREIDEKIGALLSRLRDAE